MTDEYLTTAETAERLRVSAETVRRWCRAGRLPTVRIGRAHRIPLSALLSLAADSQPPADASEPEDQPPAQPVAADETLSPGWARADPAPGRGHVIVFGDPPNH